MFNKYLQKYLTYMVLASPECNNIESLLITIIYYILLLYILLLLLLLL